LQKKRQQSLRFVKEREDDIFVYTSGKGGEKFPSLPLPRGREKGKGEGGSHTLFPDWPNPNPLRLKKKEERERGDEPTNS